MPNDRGSNSILQNTDWSKYQTLGKFMGANTTQAVQPVKTDTDQSNALDVLEQVLDETEAQREPSVLDQALPKAVEQSFVKAEQAEAAAQVAQVSPGNKQKEILQTAPVSEAGQAETAPKIETPVVTETAPQAEQVANPEIAELSQEIKELGQETQEQREAAEIKEQQNAINNLAQAAKQAPPTVDPVVVLPITEDKMKQGQRKGAKFSLRWLAEWAEKISKMFSGAVLYKEEAVSETDV